MSGLLLLLFAFSITPKRPLHDLFANHRDTPVKSSGKVKQFSKSGFNCNCDNLVVESSFIAFAFPTAPIPPVNYGAVRCSLAGDIFLQMPARYFELRGPPAL